jgi:hypothetical protein
MQLFKSIIVLAGAIFFANSFAFAGSETNAPAIEAYQVNKGIDLKVLKVENGFRSSLSGQQVHLRSGDELTILDRSSVPGVGEVVRVGIDAGADDNLPSDFWVSSEELLHAGLTQLSEEDSDISDDTSASDSILGIFDGFDSGAKKKKKGMTYCYRNVKNFLMKNCGVHTYLPGSAAYQAASILPKFGFSKISSGFAGFAGMKSCTVCVLAGGTHKCGKKACGDVVVKTGSKWFGWGSRSTPYLPGRQPIGCFHK